MRRPFVIGLIAVLLFCWAAIRSYRAETGWMRGDWVLDVDRTRQEADAFYKHYPNEQIIKTITDSLAKSPRMELLIDDDNVTTLNTPVDESYGYSIIRVTEDDFIVRRNNSGLTEHYGHDGDEIYYVAAGGDMKIYFKPKP